MEMVVVPVVENKVVEIGSGHISPTEEFNRAQVRAPMTFAKNSSTIRLLYICIYDKLVRESLPSFGRVCLLRKEPSPH